MQVVHNHAARRFEAQVEGHLCVCDYHVDDREHEVTFTHTYVPTSLRGRGVAGTLVDAALNWARAEPYRVVPACSYVRVYMQRHPEWLGLMADEHP